MRQQNNGRRRQNRGLNRRNYNNGGPNGNINKNTVIESSGPDGRQRGSVSQLNEKYTSLASDASSSDDRILAESFLQFADHYYRVQKEIDLNKEFHFTGFYGMYEGTIKVGNKLYKFSFDHEKENGNVIKIVF